MNNKMDSKTLKHAIKKVIRPNALFYFLLLVYRHELIGVASLVQYFN